ncbi:MAG: hypothetical protein NTW92_02945 [Bacteroidetes bacterium]|jgi:hypothetical protein|nr:hypothetical protein [Bacteroidota bacterium]
MKKMFLMGIVFLGIFVTVQAQDSPLKEYVGKYTFAEGSPVTEVVLAIQDTILVSTSSVGSFPLEKKGVDTFYLAAYDALVIFKRGGNNVVEGVGINVQGMELIGKKSAASSALKQDFYFEDQIWADKLYN